jgi:hypothetical protein
MLRADSRLSVGGGEGGGVISDSHNRSCVAHIGKVSAKVKRRDATIGVVKKTKEAERAAR